MNLLLPPPKYWNYRLVPLCLACRDLQGILQHCRRMRKYTRDKEDSIKLILYQEPTPAITIPLL
jgi:hypothetical protein